MAEEGVVLTGEINFQTTKSGSIDEEAVLKF